MQDDSHSDGSAPAPERSHPPREYQRQEHHRQDSKEDVASEASQGSGTHHSWSSYGRRWETEWQEQREREIEAERAQRMLEDLQEEVS